MNRACLVCMITSFLLVPASIAYGQAPAQTAKPAQDLLRQMEEEVSARRAKLQEMELQVNTLKANLDRQSAEYRLAMQRFLEAKDRAARDQNTMPSGIEARLERLEKTVARLEQELRASRPGESKKTSFRHVLLKAYANQKLDESMGSGSRPANTLASLPKSVRAYLDIPFNIEDGLIQLGSQQLPERPAKVTDIKANLTAEKLHFLHAAAFYDENEVPIGSYVVHYTDGTSETIPIVNGKDVSDWWKYSFSKDPTQGKVAWKGENDAAKEFDATLQLFLTTWTNPKPKIPIATIDYISTMDTSCAPFCVAITAQEP